MCPPSHLWFFSPATLPRLLANCGFEILEVATLRGDGNNLYQHALMALGMRLNSVRRALAGRGVPPAAPSAPARDLRPEALHQTPRQRAWLRLLLGTQAPTDILDRVTRPLTASLEAAGWGDELLCYARRPVGSAASM
jgi:hypothetical protein